MTETADGQAEMAGARAETADARAGTADAQAETASAVVDRFNAAWDAHDLDAALEMISDDCVFDSTSPAPDGKRFTGKAAIRAAWEPIFDDPASRFTAEESFAAGSRVVVRWRYDWVCGYVRGVDIFTVRDGKVTEKLAYVKG
jgi:ketosteroid isomerase-like protein